MSEPVGLYVTKSDYAYTRIREGILSGEFAAGTVLHQSMLAKTIGISTTPLREAMRRLMTEGLVELDAHRDARVSDVDRRGGARPPRGAGSRSTRWLPLWLPNGVPVRTSTACGRR